MPNPIAERPPIIEFNVFPNLKKTITLVKAEIKILELKLFESVRVMVYLKDENDSVMDTRGFLIDKSNGYDQWSNDDKTLIDIIKKLIQ
jgi:hypothetical protein